MARMVAALETLPCSSRNARSFGESSRWISVNARSPPKMTWPWRANPSAKLAASEPTPAIAIEPSAIHVMNT